MTKLILVGLVAATFASCNNESDSTKTTATDTVTIKTDSMTNNSLVDGALILDSSSKKDGKILHHIYFLNLSGKI